MPPAVFFHWLNSSFLDSRRQQRDHYFMMTGDRIPVPAIEHRADAKRLRHIRGEVEKLCRKFPMYRSRLKK
jgi:hypothetical protein